MKIRLFATPIAGSHKMTAVSSKINYENSE
jgi:hypothetical protein